ncbi:hypothetical protein BT96DRAFT_185438 [Gymnopus androsaceus JB14]|uniref:Uncharacterized protein n=1 Tax=Gymnopus androsaceus JB14 TaxID=1447944 RepID=A0A6A4GBF6_9AGAR|nr:hypothetical protein BT96DRAFT_185438 [Gymnopus androsaceus JB14]
MRRQLQWKTDKAGKKIFLLRPYYAYRVHNSAKKYKVFVNRSTTQTQIKIAREDSERLERHTESRSAERQTEHRSVSNGRAPEPNMVPVAVIETSSMTTTLYDIGTPENPMVFVADGQVPASVKPGILIVINTSPQTGTSSSSASTPPDHIRAPVVDRHHNESAERHSTSEDLQTEILHDFEDALDIADTILSSLDLDTDTDSFVTDGVNSAPYPDDDSEVEDSDYYSVISSSVITLGTQ